jgi:hypothetical protein
MDTLEEIRRQIRSGQWQAARRALIARLGDHPHDVDAWMLLATVLDDAEKQADCYRQVLGLVPGHRQAARALAQLAASGEEARPRVLRCPGCGGAMEMYVAGALHDKRALSLLRHRRRCAGQFPARAAHPYRRGGRGVPAG